MGSYRIIGVESSPYAVKVRAVLRYRRLTHVWVARMPQFFDETSDVRPLLMPIVQFPSGEYRTDSTPIIRELEQAHKGRSVVPPTPGLAFVSDLIEDMADEFLTKSLFHYRFSHLHDADAASHWVMDDAHPGLSSQELEEKANAFKARQIERMPLVGCTAENAPVHESFYEELLEILGPFVATDRFLFGSRPSLADFGIFGQLRTLSRDPTAGALMHERTPRLISWTGRLDDASGVEGRWTTTLGQLDDVVASLLELAGRYYLPYLTANARAVNEGNSTFETTVNARPYSQSVFRYQAKCLSYLTGAWRALEPSARGDIAPLLDASGCTPYLDS